MLFERIEKKQSIPYAIIIFVLFFFFLPISIYSQVNSPPYIPPGYQIKPKTDLFSYDAGINQYNKDTFLYINPTFNFTSSNWGLGFQLPLNILMLDKDPKYDNSKLGMLRPGDYDSKTDYQRLLNYVWLGKINKGNITFGSGNRMIIKGGKLDNKYKITVPEWL